jgi:uncharacterized protein
MIKSGHIDAKLPCDASSTSPLKILVGQVPNLIPANLTLELALAKGFGTNHFISIDKQLKPVLMKAYKNITSSNLLKCNQIECPIWFRSHSKLIPTLSVIDNVSKSTGILLLNGENDSQTPVQQSFLLQQRLTDVKHPDHTLITYANLGHTFYPSSQWSTGIGPIESYVLADLYSWLEAHSGFTRLPSFVPFTYSSSSSNSTTAIK